jgi:hypothetical protein
MTDFFNFLTITNSGQWGRRAAFAANNGNPFRTNMMARANAAGFNGQNQGFIRDGRAQGENWSQIRGSFIPG